MIRYSSLRLNTVGEQTVVGMGDEAGGDKGIHVARVGAQLQMVQLHSLMMCFEKMN